MGHARTVVVNITRLRVAAATIDEPRIQRQT
jgi:hypothetical protein